MTLDRSLVWDSTFVDTFKSSSALLPTDFLSSCAILRFNSHWKSAPMALSSHLSTHENTSESSTLWPGALSNRVPVSFTASGCDQSDHPILKRYSNDPDPARDLLAILGLYKFAWLRVGSLRIQRHQVALRQCPAWRG